MLAFSINSKTKFIQSAKNKLFFQPKLSINQPNDIYDQEADAMADKVMRMPDPSTGNNLFFKPAITSLQRKCAHCEEEEKKIQRKEISSDPTTVDVNLKNSCKTKKQQNTQITHTGYSFIQRQNGGDTEQRPRGTTEVSPRFIVVPPPVMQPLQLPLPPLLGGERRPRTSFLNTNPDLSLRAFGSFPAFIPQPSLFPGQLPLSQAGILSSSMAQQPSSTTPAQAPSLTTPVQPPSSTTPAQPSGVPVNTSVGSDVGYQPGEGHAVADISITLTADLTAAQFRLGRNSNWSMNFLDQPNAGVTFSFDPQAGAPGEAVSLSHQFGINALSLVLNRDDDRLIEIAATAGIQLDSSGTTSATVGGQLTYHPTDRVGIFVNGGASIIREGNTLTPHWGSFTLGVTFDIDQDRQPQRR